MEHIFYNTSDMSLLHRLLTHLGFSQNITPRHSPQVESFRTLITELAQQEQRSEEEIHADLLAAALAQHQSTRDLRDRWRSLSLREQEVAALTCLGYTNNEIAARLGISHTTIKTHVKNILTKYRLHGKAELRIALEGWDFRGWDRAPHK
jgi:DNA-binding NarL/FixJ family response regulator